MKKTYISPTTLEFQVQLQTIIAASQFETPKPGTQPQNEQNLTTTDNPYDGEFHSRRHNSIWDDEDTEEW